MANLFELLKKILVKVSNAENADTPKISITVPISTTFSEKNKGKDKMGKWHYFTDDETKGMKDDICYKLDRARELFDAPIELTCGYRSPEHNAEIGGVADSAHTKGMAADVKAPIDPTMREKLMWAFGAAGFKRVETAPRHFHVDTDDTKPTPCFWEGTDH